MECPKFEMCITHMEMSEGIQEFGIHLVDNGEPGKVFEGRVTWPSVLKGGHFLLKK